MHLHDALEKEAHLALGAGEMDIAKYLTLTKEQGSRIVLETKMSAVLRQSVSWPIKHGWLTP